jgi:ABC-type polysaccharide transport system, permease component
MYNLLSMGGIINNLRQAIGMEAIMFLGSQEHFRGILVLSDIWKEAGWGTIIYLAAITGIDMQIYEAANIDGANRLQKMFYITLPSIKNTIVVLLILSLGNLLNVGFEQILVLYNSMVMPVGDVIDTYVYRTGLLSMRFSYATAGGIFKAAVSAIMLFMSDFIAKRMGERGLF